MAGGPEGELRLTVADDGRGGDIEEGSGLIGMRARLAAAGGELQVRSGPGGTRLTARLPRRLAPEMPTPSPSVAA